tara:strand:- start:102 stop:635 length:534 start_codon:yes stop_codon:yes gene_type:complete
MQIYQKKLEEIKPYTKNPRKKYDIKKVADSITEFGFQQPIVVDTSGTIIVGHGRYEASKHLNLKTIPVVIADLPPEKAKAYRIADNKTNEYSDWDNSLLNQEFTDLLDINYDLLKTGFDEEELKKFFDDSDLTSIDTSEKDLPEKYELMIELENIEDQESLYNELKERGYTCKVLSF